MDLAKKIEGYGDSLDAETATRKLREHWHAPALLAIFLLAFTLRYMPANGMKYLQAVDPYMIFRMSQHLALEGNLPQLDFSRFFPYATPTYYMNNGEFIIPALLYNAGFGIFFNNYLEWAQFFPAMMGASSVVVMYFLGKELFDRNTGLAAAFFLAVTVGALRRTSAGFFEKEPIGTFLMMTSLLFFTRAWKQENWNYGILSGLSLGIFTVSWGGSDMLWLLYPIIAAATVFINEDIRSLIASYTPTILIGAFFAAIVNASRFTFSSNQFLMGVGVLGLIWTRYLVEQLDLVPEEKLPYFVPGMAVLGGIAAILSPLYSDFIAGKVIGIFKMALQTGSGVVAGTVQENAPPAASDLVRGMGSGVIGNIDSGLEFIGMLVSPWTLMVVGVPFMATSLILMMGRKYGLISEMIPARKHTSYVEMVFVAWLVFISALVQNAIFMGAFAALVIGASLLVLTYLLDEDSSLTISTLTMGAALIGSAVFALRTGGIFSSTAQLVLIPAFLAFLGSFVVLFVYRSQELPDRKIDFKWYTIIPILWVGSNVFGGTTRSRLVFLSTFSVALAAGYGASKSVERLREIDYSGIKIVDPNVLRTALTIFVVILVVFLNLGSGYLMAGSMGGSPSPSPQAWEPSLNYMDNQTPEGSVVMSWWDYGYYFQTLGRRASVADGGNFNYYVDNRKNRVNFPLARYLNTSNRPEDRQFLEKHSVDYIWLDYTMIGKFSAVSQIANEDNSQFQVINRVQTPGSLRNSLSSDGNQSVAQYQGRLGGNFVQIFAPIESTNTSLDLSGAPTIRLSNGGTANIDCVLTEDGKKTYDVENAVNFCAAEDPVYSLERGMSGTRSRLVMVPKKIADSTFVRLYIQDGWGVPYAEKVPEASNGYIKMWKVDTNQTER